jgi:hypothetical protein
MLAGRSILWKNGFEARFCLSTAESEIRAIFAIREAIKHVLYLKKIFNSLALSDTADNASIFEDNAAAIRYAYNPSPQSTMKYLETDIYWIHDSIQRKEISIIDAVNQLADIGTKLNPGPIFLSLRSRLMRCLVSVGLFCGFSLG